MVNKEKVRFIINWTENDKTIFIISKNEIIYYVITIIRTDYYVKNKKKILSNRKT